MSAAETALMVPGGARELKRNGNRFLVTRKVKFF